MMITCTCAVLWVLIGTVCTIAGNERMSEVKMNGLKSENIKNIPSRNHEEGLDTHKISNMHVGKDKVQDELYDGEFKDDKPHGHGRLQMRDRSIYEGEWNDGKRHGQGRLQFPDGAIYEGQWKDDSRYGKGRFQSVDGKIFEGEWRDNQPHGQGRYQFPNGETYEGEWKDGKRHGQGRFQLVGGETYEGEWKDGKRHGQGRFQFPDGSMYKGVWKDDKRHGQGLLQFADGSIYEGEWRDDKRHQGRYQFSNGEIYEGDIKSGKLSRFYFKARSLQVGSLLITVFIAVWYIFGNFWRRALRGLYYNSSNPIQLSRMMITSLLDTRNFVMKFISRALRAHVHGEDDVAYGVPTEVTRSPAQIMREMFALQGTKLDPENLDATADQVARYLGSIGVDADMQRRACCIGDNMVSSENRGMTSDSRFDCFISYRVATDAHLAESLCDKLRLKGYTPFLDKKCLPPGQEWRDNFTRALMRSRVFLPLISVAGLQQCEDITRDHRKDSVLLEYQIALDKRGDRLMSIAGEDRSAEGREHLDIYPILVGTSSGDVLTRFSFGRAYSDSVQPS
jgi:hypothetical protein